MLNYSVSIKWSDEDGGFIAVIPELPGLSAFGETQEEAIAELKVASEAYLESLKSAGETLPPPEKLLPFSGQIRLRMPKKLHGRLSEAAENEAVSLNTYIVSLLSERQAEEKANKLYEQLLDAIQCQYMTPMKTDTFSLRVKAGGEYRAANISNETFIARRSN